MGKSSFVEMMMDNIKKKDSSKNEYLVHRVDCSLLHRKDKLWISILNQLLDILSTQEIKKQVFKSRFFSFKIEFFFENFKSWLKKKWWLVTLFIFSLSYVIYSFVKISFSNMLIPKDFKEALALISIATFGYSLLKTTSSLFKQNIFLLDDRNEDSSYIRSLKEFRQFINLLNHSKKKKDIKILLILDELDRIHKDLLPDIIELIQLFKGLYSEVPMKEREKNKSIVSFAFSFNHDILFPVIGKNISLGDRQLLVSSYKKYKGFVEGLEKDTYINYYHLGKEYMDKYLDLSLYLQEEMDYTELIDELFLKSDNNLSIEVNEGSKKDNDIPSSNHLEDLNLQLDDNIEGYPPFTNLEKSVIEEAIKSYASKIEPRKIIRLKNVLIMLKKLNHHTNTEVDDSYATELREFIMKFLELEQDKTTSVVTSTAEELSQISVDRYLKHTEYFIQSKIKSS